MDEHFVENQERLSPDQEDQGELSITSEDQEKPNITREEEEESEEMEDGKMEEGEGGMIIAREEHGRCNNAWED